MLRSVVFFALVSLIGCDRSPPKAAPDPTPTAPPIMKSAAATLRGTWRVESFTSASPAGSASAAALNAEANSEAAQAMRITYTGDQVKISAPGAAILSSSYEVKEDTPTWCRILNGKDEVIITFKDDDHMTIDRKGNAYGTKMNMIRVIPPAPAASASGAGSAKP